MIMMRSVNDHDIRVLKFSGFANGPRMVSYTMNQLE